MFSSCAASIDSLPMLLLVGATVAGTAAHQFVKHVEVDEHPLSILLFIIGSHIVIAGHLVLFYGFQTQDFLNGKFQDALWDSFVVVAGGVVSLWANMLVYRAWFHPLSRAGFKGPFGARLTKFWALGEVVRSKIRWYQVVGELHEKYGDYVRTGPRELSISDPAAIIPLLGYNSRATKGPFYGALEPSLHTNRDADFHRSQRKIWDLAFKQSLKDYGASIEEFTDTLLTRIQRNVGREIDVNELCMHYSYDAMSSMAFGNSTKFLEGNQTEKATNVLKGVHDGVMAVGALVHVPWILTVVEGISFAGPIRQFNLWSAEEVERRRNAKNHRPDVIGHLLEHTEDNAAGRRLLNSESRLIIVAGSDTTASALTTLFILLAAHPEYQRQLRKETDTTFAEGTYSCGTPQPILESIINEGLRLYNPVSFSPQRVTPAEGLNINGVQVPPDTVVSLNRWQIHRDPRNFVNATRFIPERWTTQPHLVLNKSAYMAFSLGPYSCPGRSLAMMELRSVIARTVQKYDIWFPLSVEKLGFDEEEFFSGIMDHFTIGVPKCELVFREREGGLIEL